MFDSERQKLNKEEKKFEKSKCGSCHVCQKVTVVGKMLEIVFSGFSFVKGRIEVNVRAKETKENGVYRHIHIDMMCIYIYAGEMVGWMKQSGAGDLRKT